MSENYIDTFKNPLQSEDNNYTNKIYNDLPIEVHEDIFDIKKDDLLTPYPNDIFSEKPLQDTLEKQVDEQKNNGSNVDEDKEYLKRLQELLEAYTNYQRLLSSFGKTDIKEVLADAKNLALLNSFDSEEPTDNYDEPKKI